MRASLVTGDKKPEASVQFGIESAGCFLPCDGHVGFSGRCCQEADTLADKATAATGTFLSPSVVVAAHSISILEIRGSESLPQQPTTSNVALNIVGVSSPCPRSARPLLLQLYCASFVVNGIFNNLVCSFEPHLTSQRPLPLHDVVV